MRALFYLIVLTAYFAVIGAPVKTHATDNHENGCGASSEALARARQALKQPADDRRGEREALRCLIEVTAELDARLAGLSNGSLPFEGQIHAPKGFVMNKPRSTEQR